MSTKEEIKPEVCLAWATKKRHIAINRKVLCETEGKTPGYSVKNGQYNSISLSGLPNYRKTEPDVIGGHPDGIIEYAPLDKQPFTVIERSICKKCLSKYKSLFK